MPEPVPQSQPPPRPEDALPWLRNLAVPLLPVFACFLGGATQKWAEGIVLTLLGLCLIIWPPRISLGLVTNCTLVAFLVAVATAFLPARWFFSPAWRSVLVDDFSIVLPHTLSAQ